MNTKIMGLLLALILGLMAGITRADDYSNAQAYGLTSGGQVMGRNICGATNIGAPDLCSIAWTQVDEDESVKFIQAGGNILFEVYANGQIWITFDPFRPGGVVWLNAGVDAGVKSPTQLTVGRSERNLSESVNIYKASNNKLYQLSASGATWQELPAFGAKGKVTAVSGDFVSIIAGNTGLLTLFHISTGQQVIDRQYGAFVGALDEFPGSISTAYLARFIPGTTSNQETVISTYGSNPQYGPAFTWSDLRGLAVAVTNSSGPNSAYLLLPRSTTFGDNKVLMVNENTAPFTGNNHPGVVLSSPSSGLTTAIAAATSYEPGGAGMRSFLWTLKPVSAGGDILEYKCTSTTCSFVSKASKFSTVSFTQLVATTRWVSGDAF